MSYFLDTYEWPFEFIAGLIAFLVLSLVYCYLAEQISKRFFSGSKGRSFLLGLAVFGAAISFYLLLMYVPDYLNDGQIEYTYLVKKNNETRLVVWFTREDTPAGMTEAYSHRIKCFDLDTGAQRGRLTLSRRYFYNDYRIYGPFHHFAWGYTAQSGMVYLDLFEASVVADEKDILKRNPMLGEKVRLTTGANGKRFDPVTFGLYVYTAKGDVYRINPDLNATHLRAIEKEKEKHVRQTCAVCQHMAQFIDVKKTKNGWHWDDAPGEILRFISKDGRILNTIDVHAMFDDKTYLYAAARVKGEIWLFMTMKRYTLSAVRTEASTGKLIGKIDFF